VTAGYDGAFGIIKVFTEPERRALGRQRMLFADLPATKKRIIPLKGPALSGAVESSVPEETPPSPPEAPVSRGPLAGLNREQLEAARHGSGPALIIAGPGTGKTRVLTRRVAHLIEEHAVQPEQILAVTFTHKAAGEMQERLQALLAQRQAQAVRVSTFHALGYAWLREQLSPGLSLIDPEEKEGLLASLGVDRSDLGRTAERISAAKQQLMLPQHVEDEEWAPLYWDYQNLLSEHDLLDFDDLICRTTRLLLDDPDIAAAYRQRYPWVMVDEYQDVNYAQYRMIRALCGDPRANLCVIGDPNQAIYGFRGADSQYIERFQADWPQARRYSLQTSYRCPQTILRASGQVVAATDGFLHGLQSGVKLQLVQQPSDRAEAEYIARCIERSMGGLRSFSMDSDITDGHASDAGQSLDDFAILVRTGAQMPALEKALDDHAIPHQVVGRTPFHRQEPIRSILDVTRLALTPQTPLLAERLAARGILTAAQRTGLQLDPAEPAHRALQRIVTRFFPAALEQAPLLLRDLYDRAEQSGIPIGQWVHVLRLGTSADTYRAKVERVTLMTLHAAKGLEFPCVFVAGCEAGLLPYALHPGREADPAEERRLLYVGMTRAQQQLTLTWARSRHLHGRRRELPRSAFLDAIEKELVALAPQDVRHPRKPVDNQMRLFE
jgi:superfamily I DNA/RNA helicase